MEKILECYPFRNCGVTIAEEQLHGGVEYVLNKNGEYASFEVFSMFEGNATFGVSQEFGKYFVISKRVGDLQYDCLYGCLDNINENLQKYAIIQGDKEFMIPARYSLGWASRNGNSKSIRRLHIELVEKNLKIGERRNINPYGVLVANAYPRPGENLAALNHFWITDMPEFVK